MRDPRPAPPLAAWILAGAMLAVLAGATAAGFAVRDRPFVRYNLERIAAAERDARRAPDAPLVVALGASRLRHATLDEDGMAGLGARHGLDGLRFLRIVHNSGQFADFEPFLERILALRPDVLLLEIDLLFKERRTLPFYHQYLRDLIDVPLRGRPYREDQEAQQYGKPCPRAEDPDWDADTGRLDRFMAHFPAQMRFSPELAAYDRAGAFMAAARARGVRTALLHLRSQPALEARLHGPGNDYLPAALERVGRDPALALWRFPAAWQEDGLYCDYVHLTAEGRSRYSAWLVARIATLLRPDGSVRSAFPHAAVSSRRAPR